MRRRWWFRGRRVQKSPRHNLTDCSVHSAGVRVRVLATAYHLGVLTCALIVQTDIRKHRALRHSLTCIQILHKNIRINYGSWIIRSSVCAHATASFTTPTYTHLLCH